MTIYGINIKPGMVIKTREDVTYVAFPMTNGGIAFANITYGGWRKSIPPDIEFIRDVTPYDCHSICSGEILWQEKIKRLVDLE